MTVLPDRPENAGPSPDEVAAAAEVFAAHQGVTAAAKVAEAAAANNWPTDVTVEMLRTLGLAEVPVVARVLDRHGLTEMGAPEAARAG